MRMLPESVATMQYSMHDRSYSDQEHIVLARSQNRHRRDSVCCSCKERYLTDHAAIRTAVRLVDGRKLLSSADPHSRIHNAGATHEGVEILRMEYGIVTLGTGKTPDDARGHSDHTYVFEKAAPQGVPWL